MHTHSNSSPFHVTHPPILLAPTHTHNSHCTSALFPSQTIQSLYTDKHIVGTPTLQFSFLRPVLSQTAQQCSLSLLSLSLCNSSLRSQLQTKRSFPTWPSQANHLSRKSFIQHLRQEEDLSRKTSQLQHHEEIASCNIKKD